MASVTCSALSSLKVAQSVHCCLGILVRFDFRQENIHIRHQSPMEELNNVIV